MISLKIEIKNNKLCYINCEYKEIMWNKQRAEVTECRVKMFTSSFGNQRNETDKEEFHTFRKFCKDFLQENIHGQEAH